MWSLKIRDLSDKVVCDLGAVADILPLKACTKGKKVIAVDIDREAPHVIDSLKFKTTYSFYERNRNASHSRQ